MMGPLQWLRRCAVRVLCGSTLVCAAGLISAQDTQEISRLIRLGQLDAASSKVDALLAPNPKDAQARFLKGVVLSELGKSVEAIAVFQSLIEDYPELPEPYNNLASLLAAKGQYEQAKAALEMAIQTNPSYATAYENLGDVYARMAGQAYDKALQLDKTNATAQAKLRSIRNAFSAEGKPAAAAPIAPRTPAKGEASKPAASAMMVNMLAGNQAQVTLHRRYHPERADLNATGFLLPAREAGGHQIAQERLSPSPPADVQQLDVAVWPR